MTTSPATARPDPNSDDRYTLTEGRRRHLVNYAYGGNDPHDYPNLALQHFVRNYVTMIASESTGVAEKAYDLYRAGIVKDLGAYICHELPDAISYIVETACRNMASPDAMLLLAGLLKCECQIGNRLYSVERDGGLLVNFATPSSESEA